MLVVGGEGLVVEVEKAGFTVTRSAEDAPAAVVQGFAPEVGWAQLAEAAFALQAPTRTGGIPWIATNTDWTIPQARGIAPGNGTLVSAVHTAVGRLPTVAGKPETPIFEEAVARFGAQQPLFIGDRLDTDILGANRAGMPSVLVLTGIDRAKQVLAAPRRIAADVHPRRPAPAARAVPGDESCADERRDASAARPCASTAPTCVIVSEGDRQIDLLRAGARGDLGLRPRDLRLPRSGAPVRRPVPPAVDAYPRA